MTEAWIPPWTGGNSYICSSLSHDWEFWKHGLINYKDTKAKCCHLKKFTCNVTLRQVFIRVYKLEIQSVTLVFRPSFSPSNLLSDSPPFPVSKYSVYSTDSVWLGGGGGHWVLLETIFFTVHCHAPPPPPLRSHRVVLPDFQPIRVSEEPVSINLFRQNPVFTSLHLRSPVLVLPPQGRYSETGFHIWHGL